MESTAGNNTKKLNVKVINEMEEIVINDTLVNVGFTMNTEGVNLVNIVYLTMSIVMTQSQSSKN